LSQLQKGNSRLNEFIHSLNLGGNVGTENFKDLMVWQRAKDLAVEVYRHTALGELCKDFGLRDQMRRSAVSVPSNIAEGEERETAKEAVRHMYIAKGSLGELRTQIIIASEVGYLEQDLAIHLQSECDQIGKMLGSLIRYRSQATARIRNTP
jgi:four helix bundle protein